MLDELRTHLEEGLHIENLQAMLAIAKRLAQGASEPLPYYLLASVFGDLDSLWAGLAVPTHQHERADQELVPLIRRLVFDLQRQAPERELTGSMNRLILRFIELQQDGSIG